MSKHMLMAAALGALTMVMAAPARDAAAQTVFQAAGPDAAAIQGAVDAYRAELGEPNNGNAAGPLAAGRREINWDGGGSTNTTDPVTPFDVFLNTRGARFTTPGQGLSQAPPSGGAQGGLEVLFNNPTYGETFQTFSAPRLFTPVGSRTTDGVFFLPGSAGSTPATVRGFGAVFTDVDQPNGTARGRHSTKIAYFDAGGQLIYTGLVPSAPGDRGLSFFGVVFDDARIARVQITTGDFRPGSNDGLFGLDIVMMDDFIYGEPQVLP
jgi:hypothetical protein